MKDDRTFWNRIAARYAAKPVPDEAIYQRKLALTRSLFTADATVLEIGCGTGTTALHHAPFVKRLLATDFSEDMIAIARQKAEQLGVENIDLQCRDTGILTEYPETFDVIMAHSLLHLLSDRQQTIQHAYDALKPGAYWVTSTACLSGPMRVLQPIAPLMKWLGYFPSVYFFSSQQLVNEHLAVGFQIKESWQPDGRTLFLIAQKPG